jgi:hypothetical protein
MLGRLEMTVDECIMAYVELSKEIFPEDSIGQTGWWPKLKRFTSAYQQKAWFNAQVLEDCLKKTIRKKLGEGEDEQGFLTQDTKCKV